ncbi:ABC transporter permease subunit (plasmid) [Sinorhizobium meliloti]|uniref:ABC transporter permease subunit n=1 Tax=Sinorhizobium TaxID=28105 RepID=UPI000FDA5565|nr:MULTISPECIES: ABC transporter permease subunit [Sinorhizobium]MBO1965227.1 ABC transporter permease subunit [Sinorhizobium medicae]MDW9359037.1 ABC transporter permease subunit [Sinorhizobium meliloti]MDW9418513.1 ABC transporter permease subunit [Sinorhizobium meliloti]MDW9514624.1 ABC transporter permease subunit [Sinorhizobium meliloti]MDW9621628.1 ABC transporter permease subunit [Sinorhizobium meliloti]
MTWLETDLQLAIDWFPYLMAGVGMTLLLSTGSLLIGVFVGGLGATLKIRGSVATQLLMQLYTTIVRSVPQLIIIYYFYFGLNAGLRSVPQLPGLPSPLELPVILVAFLSLGFIAGALAVELFRTAYAAVPQSEVLAGKAYGMPPFMLFRRVLFPHIARYSLPGLGNVWLHTLKDATLISVMGVTELMRSTTVAAESTGEPFLFYLLCSLLYLIITIASGGLFAHLERRYTV